MITSMTVNGSRRFSSDFENSWGVTLFHTGFVGGELTPPAEATDYRGSTGLGSSYTARAPTTASIVDGALPSSRLLTNTNAVLLRLNPSSTMRRMPVRPFVRPP